MEVNPVKKEIKEYLRFREKMIHHTTAPEVNSL
jgi:hypothetical protein